MKLSIGSDHAGYQYKEEIIKALTHAGHEVKDCGTKSEESVDYPDYIHLVAKDIENGASEKGIVICGSGQGAAMTANKHQGVRAALCWNKEITELSRQHNNANVISIPARVVSINLAITMIFVFLATAFEGGRHQRRVDKISCI